VLARRGTDEDALRVPPAVPAPDRVRAAGAGGAWGGVQIRQRSTNRPWRQNSGTRASA